MDAGSHMVTDDSHLFTQIPYPYPYPLLSQQVAEEPNLFLSRALEHGRSPSQTEAVRGAMAPLL